MNNLRKFEKLMDAFAYHGNMEGTEAQLDAVTHLLRYAFEEFLTPAQQTKFMKDPEIKAYLKDQLGREFGD